MISAARASLISSGFIAAIESFNGRLDESGDDEAHQNAALLEPAAQRFRVGMHRRLAGAIGRRIGQPAQAGDGADEGDMAVAAAHIGAISGSTVFKTPDEIGRKERPHGVRIFAEAVAGEAGGYARIGDCEIEGARGVLRGDPGAHRIAIANIESAR